VITFLGIVLFLLTAAIIFGGVAINSLKKSVDAYSSKKGENLATKEDIGGITKIVEEIKFQNQKLLGEAERKHSLRMAAVNKRLATHQKAYELWIKLLWSVHSEEASKVAYECQEWWLKNNLYLEPKSREAFRHAYSAASFHKQIVDAGKFAIQTGTSQPELIKNINNNFETIKRAGEIIEADVALPPLNLEENKPIES
jgi:hypothetical protein